MLCAKAYKMFMRAVQQIVHAGSPADRMCSPSWTECQSHFLSDFKLIRPLLLLWRILWTRKLWPERRRQESARLRLLEIFKHRHGLAITFVIPPLAAWNNPQRYTRICVSPHISARMVSLMWCQIAKLSPVPNDLFAQLQVYKKKNYAGSESHSPH